MPEIHFHSRQIPTFCIHKLTHNVWLEIKTEDSEITIFINSEDLDKLKLAMKEVTDD